MRDGGDFGIEETGGISWEQVDVVCMINLILDFDFGLGSSLTGWVGYIIGEEGWRMIILVWGCFVIGKDMK